MSSYSETNIMAEVYRDQLLYLSAWIDTLHRKYPGNAFREELKQANRTIALTVHDTHLHYDQEHYDAWEKLIAETKQLLKKVQIQMKYRSHYAEVICYKDEEDGRVLYHGKVIGTDDLITVGGKTLEEAERDFHDAIDDLLDEKNVNSGY